MFTIPLFNKQNKKPKMSLAYFKLLPHNDHALDSHVWVNNPPFLRFEPLMMLGSMFGGRYFYRFVVLIDDEKVSLHIGFPPEKKRSVEAALRGTCPKVSAVPEDNPVANFFRGDISPHAIAFKAASKLAPFNSDESLVEFQSVLAAFGAGRRDGIWGVFDVCFEGSPLFKKKMVDGLRREIGKINGTANQPLLGGVDLGASSEAIWSALGGKRVIRAPRRNPQTAYSSPLNKEIVNAYTQRMAARGVFRVRVRAAVGAEYPGLIAPCLKAVDGALQSISYYNKLIWAPVRGGLVRDIIEGKIGFAEPSFMMTERELAQLVVIPGQEMESLWGALERMSSKTAPPPLSLLGDDDGDDD